MNKLFNDFVFKVKNIASSKRGKVIICSSAVVLTGVIVALIAVNAHNKIAVSEKRIATSAGKAVITDVKLDKTTLSMKTGEMANIIAIVKPSSAAESKINWISSNSAVATVDKGVVKAQSGGSATIYAEANGKKAECAVSVTSDSTASSSAPSTASSNATTNNTNTNGNNDTKKVTGTTGGNTAGGKSSGQYDGGEIDSHQKTGGNTTANTDTTASTSKPTKNYQGVNVTKTYTDEITGISQTVEFLGMGAGYCEVACGNADVNTTPEVGAAHYGLATVSLTGTNGIHQGYSTAAVSKSGTNPTFTFDNLTAGTYTMQLTAHDGTVVARYHFTVDSKGNVQ
ncbi:MAG TPA: Ig-like domain-containing protein [Ruminiclostridium sp.]|nr:Ig-like domain-containing protein [Ruminiclostridium sp.]